MKNKKLKQSILVSYILIFAIPLCILGSISLGYSLLNISEKSDVYYKNVIINSAAMIDREFLELKQYAIGLSSTRWIQKLMFMRGGEIDLERFDLIALNDYNQSFSAYCSGNYFISNMAVIFNDIDSVFIEGDTIIPIKQFLNYAFVKNSNTYNTLTDSLNQKHMGEIIYPAQIKNPTTLSNALLYKVTLPAIGTDKAKGTLIYTINKNYIDTLANIVDDNILFIIADDSDNVINLSQNAAENIFQMFKVFRLENKNKIYFKSSQRVKYYAYKFSSEATNLVFYLAVPSKYLMNKYTSMILLYLSITLMLLIFGYGISVRLTNRNIGPIETIFNLIKGASKSTHHYVNESTDLYYSLKDIISEKDKLNNQLEVQNVEMIDFYLRKLIENWIVDIDIFEEKLLHCGLYFPYAHFICLVLRYKDNNNRDFVIKNVRPPFLEKTDIIRLISLKDHDVILVNSNNEDLMREYKIFLEYIMCESDLSEDIGKNTYVGIGDVCQQLKSIALSYNKAFMASNLKLLFPESNVFTPVDISMPDNYFYYPLDQEISIVNNLRCGKYLKAEEIIQNLLITNVSVIKIAPNAIKNFFINAYYTGIRAIREQENLVSGEISEISSTMKKGTSELVDCVSIPEMLHILYSFYKDVCEKLPGSSMAKENKLKSEIVEYIQANYTNPMLSLTCLAEYLGLSVSYVSKVFNGLFGVSFLHYLNSIRIDKAKEIIFCPDMNIQEISDVVGYSNVITFRRCFKAITGVTPSEYKSSISGCVIVDHE